MTQIQPWRHLAQATANIASRVSMQIFLNSVTMRSRTSASLASPTCSLSASLAMGSPGKLKPMKSKTWRKVLCLSQGASCLKLKITLSGKGRSNFVRIRFKGFKSPSSLLRFIERLGWNCLWCGPECFQLASLYALTFFF